jgi:uncharacterized protein
MTIPKNKNIQFPERLSVDDDFTFSCGPHVPCFTECCGRLELLLTPYDVLRLKKELSISAEAFIDEFTTMRFKTHHGFPEFLMKMDSESKRCPFVTPQGCSVYENRPGACRIYPLGRAATTNPLDDVKHEFYFPVVEDHCRGFEQTKTWKIKEWLEDQGMADYNRVNDLLMDIYVKRTRGKSVPLDEKHIQMFVMSLYNLEKFRNFLFNSGFLKKFELDSARSDEMSHNDIALLEFAFEWLRFVIFREPTIKIKQ